MIISFVDYDKEYCELSWGWLNDSEIKKLTMTPSFTRESQENWFDSLRQRTDYLIWGIECNNKPIGALGMKNIDYVDKSGEYFGYIGEKEYWSKGIGTFMMEYIIKKAMESKLNKIYLKVSKFNERAIKLYLKNEFQICEETGECLKMIRGEDADNV